MGRFCTTLACAFQSSARWPTSYLRRADTATLPPRRSFIAFIVLPTLLGAHDEAVALTILVAWSVTEVARYPWIVCGSPKGGLTHKLRTLVPVVTFPLGVVGEAYACWRFYAETHAQLFTPTPEGARVAELLLGPLRYAALLQVAVNLGLGPVGYPSILKKACGRGGRRKKARANGTAHAAASAATPVDGALAAKGERFTH